MFNNFRGILNRRGDQAKLSEGPGSRTSSENNIETPPGSAEGFLCPTCMLGFPSPEALQNHYESSHFENEIVADGRGFNCPACKMKLPSEIELNAHFTRHHANQKEATEIEAMAMQVKALEEAKALLQGKLQAISQQSAELSKENSNLREERDSFKLKATKLTDNLADLKLQYDELKAIKMSLESAQKSNEDRIRKLEIEINQRPEADDVTLLQKELVSVQKMMNELTLQRENEKDSLQKQCNSVQEMCLKLQDEKMELQNLLKTYPSKEETQSLKEKVSTMTKAISDLQKELDKKESEKKKLQSDLEKYANYQDIKAMLSEKSNTLEEVQRLSEEKDALIAKLKQELETNKESMEEMKVDREKLFSKIEEGEGASAAMLQLREENARLKDQILLLQQIQGQSANETETKLEDLRTSLKKANSALEASTEKCVDLERSLAQAQNELQEEQNKKNALIEELNKEVATLQNKISTGVSQINELKQGIENSKNIVTDKNKQIENLKAQLVDKKASKFYVPDITSSQNLMKHQQKQSHEKNMDYLTIEKQNLEKRLAELGKTLPQVQADLLAKENKLADADKKLLQAEENLSILEQQKSAKETECSQMKQLYEETKTKLEELEKSVGDFEATKVEFCDKISSLNEDLLKSQMKESDLTATIEQMHKDQSQLHEKCSSLEEENKSLRSSITTLQNEKNSLLSEIEELKKALADLNEICAAHEKKIVELTEASQKSKMHADKVSKDASLEKEIYLKDKVKLQKQLESLENDCAKQLSQSQETVKSLENQLEEAEEKSAALKSSLVDCERLLKQKDSEWEEKEAHHTARIGVLTENIRTLKEDLTSEQKRRESLEQKLDEISGTKLELEAKLENALEERNSLLERCLKSETECERLQKTTADLRRKYDDCVAALQELGRENQTLQVENMKHTTRKWADDDTVTHCTACGKHFTVTIRKHHCRNCGNIFCNECSSKNATVAASKRPVRVCDICFDEVTK